MHYNSPKLNMLFNLMTPLSPLASLIQTTRRRLYKKKLLNSHKAPIPVISVGNITMGGAGKTPFVIMLADLLQNLGLKVSVINRGYRGRSKIWPKLVSCNSEIFATCLDVGDEAILIASSLPNAITVSGPDRYQCVCLSHKLGAEIAILDDGFQHLRLKRDLDIVLIDATIDIFNEGVFPCGYLREPVSSLDHADCIVITKSNPLDRETLRLKLQKSLRKDIPVFLSWNTFKYLVDLSHERIDVDKFSFKDVFVFAGIANPGYFLTVLTNLGFETKGSIFFEDHHYYTYEEIKMLFKEAELQRAQALITTKKDIVKILELKEVDEIKSTSLGRSIFYLEMETNVENSFFNYMRDRLYGILSK